MEFNIMMGDIEGSDKDLFFGPVSQDTVFHHISNNASMSDLLLMIGIFSSKSQAKKAGWNKPVPFGFTDIEIGKLKTRVTILNVKEESI